MGRARLTNYTKRYLDLCLDLVYNKISHADFLDQLENTFFGGSGLEVQVNEKDGFKTHWLEWQEVRNNDICRVERNGRRYSFQTSRINQRSIAPIELVFDVESEKEYAEAKRKLQSYGIRSIDWYTRSRGYHMHIFDPVFLNRDVKKNIVSFVGADMNKASKRTLIALEHKKHWKSGKLMRMVA